MYNVTWSQVQFLVVSVKVNDMDLVMVLDTGTSVTIMSEATYNCLATRTDTSAV